MTPFTKLKLHLERHMYKRGKHKGEAPADQHRRDKSHFRVLEGNDDTMRVRMHNTDILTAYEDGSIMISTGGWWTSTTRKNLNDALGTFVGRRMYVSGLRVFGMSQATITRAGGPTWAFYDGIRFDADCELRGMPMPFERKQADKNERAEFRDEVAKSGFKDAFPILYQSVETTEHQSWFRFHIHKVMRDEVHVNDWRAVIAGVKYPDYYHRSLNRPAYADWRDAWKVLNARATKDMTEVVRTDVLYIP